jgi:hypothetical protein
MIFHFSISHIFSQKQAEKSLTQTKKAELMLMSKYQSLQNYAMELSERETKIAKDYEDLNQQKLNLQSQKKVLFENRCSLCKIGENANELKGIIQQNTRFTPSNDHSNKEKISESFENFETFYNLHTPTLAQNFHLSNATDLIEPYIDSDMLLKFDFSNDFV